MRENLFRGKPKDKTQHYFFSQIWKDNCVDGFVYGSLVVDKDRCFIAISALCSINSVINNGIISMIEVIPETVGQYTGLTAKNGKIFEGDIVNFKTTAYFFHDCKIEYGDGCFRAVDRNAQSFPMCGRFIYEVIGNIHDNPEL